MHPNASVKTGRRLADQIERTDIAPNGSVSTGAVAIPFSTESFRPRNSHADQRAPHHENLGVPVAKPSSRQYPCGCTVRGEEFGKIMQWVNFVLGIGLEGKDLTFVQVTARAIVVFIAALAMTRVADKRFLGKMSAVDVILGFILASMLARAVNGSAAFFPTIVGGFVLVFLHKGCAALAFRSEGFEMLVKGREELIVKDGEIIEQGLRATHITHKDLLEELRQEGSVSSPEEVKTAIVERSGKVSVVSRQ